MHDFGLVAGEHSHAAGVGRCLGEDHVAGVNKNACGDVECLLASRGHEDLLRACRDALKFHEFGYVGTQFGYTVAGPVLEGALTALEQDPLCIHGDAVERQRAEVRRSVGEGDHVGPLRRPEHFADF